MERSGGHCGGALPCDRGGRHRLRITASAALPADSVLRPPDPGLVHRWAVFNQVPPNFSPAQAAAAAPLFDLATVKLKPSTPAVIAAMRSANPQLKVLVYHNGAFAQKNEGTKYPAAWYARGANGNKVVQTVFGNYLMDVSHPEWVAEVVRQCRSAKATTGADGCYTDMLMTAPLFENYVNGGKPINPAAGQVWTFPDFQVAVERIADAVRNGVPGPYGANGVARGKRWFVSVARPQDAHQPRRRRSFRDLAPRPRPVGQPVAEPGRLEARRGHGRQRRSRGAGVKSETKLWSSGLPYRAGGGGARRRHSLRPARQRRPLATAGLDSSRPAPRSSALTTMSTSSFQSAWLAATGWPTGPRSRSQISECAASTWLVTFLAGHPPAREPRWPRATPFARRGLGTGA